MIALYKYSALNPDELSFSKDDVIKVIAKEEPHWWKGELNGLTGLFPSNYVAPICTYYFNILLLLFRNILQLLRKLFIIILKLEYEILLNNQNIYFKYSNLAINKWRPLLIIICSIRCNSQFTYVFKTLHLICKKTMNFT